MNFAHPIILYIYLIAVVPILTALYYFAKRSRKKRIERFGNPAVLNALMPEASKYKRGIKFFVEMIALTAIAVALARPRGGAREASEETRGIEVMICMDVSRSMLASSTDNSKGVSRLSRAKFLLNQLIDKLDNDKVGVIAFAGYPITVVPVTKDFGYSKRLINSLDTESVTTQGTDIGAAIAMAMNNFSGATDVNKAIVIITDTEDNEANGIEMAQKAYAEGIQVDVIGVGTEVGMPIPMGSNGEYLKDYEGNVVTTALNHAAGAAIASAGGGVYINGSAGDAVSKIDEQLEAIEKSDLGEVRYSQSAERFPIFIWIAIIAIVIDVFILERRLSIFRNINFFTRNNK